jgi:cytoskeletal protein RodZ
MKSYHKLIRSGLIIEILLVIAAIVAILGMAMFVRLRNGEKAAALPQSAGLHLSYYQVAFLNAVTSSNSTSPTATTSTITSPNTVAADPSTDTNTTSPTHVGIKTLPVLLLPSPCNPVDKHKITTEYSEQVTEENDHYQQLANNLKNPVGMVGAVLTDPINILIQKHQAKLQQLYGTYQKRVSEIFCPL